MSFCGQRHLQRSLQAARSCTRSACAVVCAVRGSPWFEGSRPKLRERHGLPSFSPYEGSVRKRPSDSPFVHDQNSPVLSTLLRTSGLLGRGKRDHSGNGEKPSTISETGSALLAVNESTNHLNAGVRNSGLFGIAAKRNPKRTVMVRKSHGP